MRAVLIAVLIAGAAGSARARDAGAADADPGVDAEAAAGFVDFTDDQGLAGGEEHTSPPLEPIERESLLPDRYRGTPDAGPAAPVAPNQPRHRGCGGCGQGRAGGPTALLLAVVLLASGRRRAKKNYHNRTFW